MLAGLLKLTGLAVHPDGWYILFKEVWQRPHSIPILYHIHYTFGSCRPCWYLSPNNLCPFMYIVLPLCDRPTDLRDHVWPLSLVPTSHDLKDESGKNTINLTELEQSLSCPLTPHNQCSRIRYVDIFPLILCTPSCHWAQPYWKPSISDWRECDDFVWRLNVTTLWRFCATATQGLALTATKETAQECQSCQVPVSPRSQWPLMAAPISLIKTRIIGSINTLNLNR